MIMQSIPIHCRTIKKIGEVRYRRFVIDLNNLITLWTLQSQSSPLINLTVTDTGTTGSSLWRNFIYVILENMKFKILSQIFCSVEDWRKFCDIILLDTPTTLGNAAPFLGDTGLLCKWLLGRCLWRSFELSVCCFVQSDHGCWVCCPCCSHGSNSLTERSPQTSPTVCAGVYFSFFADLFPLLYAY